MNHSNRGHILVIFVFAVVLIFPIFNQVTFVLDDTENLENRRLSEMPVFDINLLDPFPTQFDTYYNDNFNLRNLLVRYYETFKLFVFQKSPFPDKVIIGNDGWLFLAQSDIEDYQNKNPFSEAELRAFVEELEYRKAVLDSIGCKFYFLIAPGKPNIYSEKVPFNIFRYSPIGWGESLLDYMKNNSTVSTIDLYKVLREAKKKKMLYYKLDTHWNSWGAHYAAESFLNLVAKENKNFKRLPGEISQVSAETISIGNCTRIIGNFSVFEDSDFVLARNPPQNIEKLSNESWKSGRTDSTGLLMIAGDSFTNWFIPHVAGSFDTTQYVFDNWEYKFDRSAVEKRKPKVFLLLIHEPLLKKVLDHQSNK